MFVCLVFDVKHCKIEKWFSEMQIAAQGTVENEILFLEKTKAKEILDLEFYNYERKVTNF